MQTPVPDQTPRAAIQAKPTEEEEERIADSQAIDKASKHSPDRMKFTNVLPFCFVVVIITTLYAIYIKFHCLPLLEESGGNFERGRIDFVVVNVFSLMLVVCYTMCIVVHPGTVPNTPKWRLDEESFGHAEPGVKMHETKRTGERRYCKWCARYKPDRCHHCRVCKQCILRMDHHCPWIMNCVGFRNHKYFFLLVLYSGLDCSYVGITMFSSVQASIYDETPFLTMYMLVFGETLCTLMALLVIVFLSFHVWLMLRATTTIEFCEKATKETREVMSTRSIYDLGRYRNVLSVLGPYPLFWFAPICTPLGNGLSFSSSDSTPLLAGTSPQTDASGVRLRTATH